MRLLVEGDRTGRRESNALAEDLLEGFREIPPLPRGHPGDRPAQGREPDHRGRRCVRSDARLDGPLQTKRSRRASSTQDAARASIEDRLEFDLDPLAHFPQGESNSSLPTAQRSRFTLLRRLGAGGMGVVFEAYDEERGELVALKTMRRVDPAALVRFKQEFRSLSDISHPNLVNLYQLFAVEDRWFFTMELIDGRDFLTYVRCGPELARERIPLSGVRPPRISSPRSPDFDEGRLRDGLAQLAEGVHALHAAGKLHRDIKPTNVLVTPDGPGRPARLRPDGRPRAGSRRPGPDDGPPDRRDRGPHVARAGLGLPLTAASDWYSVGVILYQALTGRLPFEGTFEEVMFRKQTGDPASPETAGRGPARGPDASLHGAARPRPERRPGGAEILDDAAGRGARGRRPRSETGEACPLIGRAWHRQVLDAAYDVARGAVDPRRSSSSAGRARARRR